MLSLSLPEKTLWTDPFGTLATRKPYDIEEVNGVHHIRRKIYTDDRDQIREEQLKLIPLLDDIHAAATEALETVTTEKKKQTEISLEWRSFHHSGYNHLKIICHMSKTAETDHVVLLAEKQYNWPSILDDYFPPLPVITTPNEQQIGTTVIALDGKRRQFDAAQNPDEVRFVYPRAVDILRHCIKDSSGPLYAFDFKAKRPNNNGQESFQAILRLH